MTKTRGRVAMIISGLAQFATIQTVIVVICFGLVYFTSQFKVSFVNKSYPVYTSSCHWDEGILYDDSGRTICRERNLFYGCQRLMNRINTNDCGGAPPFVHYGDELGGFTEQVTINIIETTTAISFGIFLVWLLLFVRRWRNAIYFLMVLCHTIASVFAGIYALNASMAMDQLKKADNDNAGQIVTIGEGFFTVMVLPPILLIHDLFIEDWYK